MQRRNVVRTILGALAGLFFGRPIQAHENAENIQVWTTIDGRRIRIVDMTDDHLRNCIFYLNKQFGREWGPWIHTYQPDIVQFYLKGNPADEWPIYDVMRREAQRRNLSWI